MVREQIMGKAHNSGKCNIIRQKTPTKDRSSPFDKQRHFFRSISANNASQELLIKGEPRLSDLAPDLVSKHRANRSSSSQKGDSAADVHYLPLTPEEQPNDYLSGDEVFVSEDSARYYNFEAINRNRPRRHSIGTFIGRERSASSSSKNLQHQETELPHQIIDNHSLSHASFPRKKCLRCSKSNLRTVNMDDILIISSKQNEAASLWVKYFINYFHQISNQANRKPLKVQYIGIEDFTGKSEDYYKELIEKASCVKLQLVVVCPSFLDFISQRAHDCAPLSSIFLADRTLALQLGTADIDVTSLHKRLMPNFLQWQRQAVGQDQDENFTKEFLGQAMAILSKVWKQQSNMLTQEKSCFSVTPKKIRQGQNSVFVLLTHPLQKDDIVKISIEKDEILYEVRSVKRRNPYILKFSVPEYLTEVTSIVNILVEKNGNIIGSRPLKCESKLKELEEILKSSNNPVDFMCQTLEFNSPDREHLDNWMMQGFQKNIPPHFNLLSNHESPFPAHLQFHKHSHEEFPTLLHFAAKFGLEKLALQLLECPGADAAYKIRNLHNMTPLEIAEHNEHSGLAGMLRGYMNMNEFSSMYHKLKEMSVVAPKTTQLLGQEHDEIENLTTNMNDLYKICPPPRPVENKVTPSSPIPDWNSSSFGIQIPSGSKEDICDIRSSCPIIDQAMQHPAHIINSSISDEVFPKFTSKPKLDNVIVEDKVQKELVEIINDFKNNVHSIAQVEKLVDEWKNRNDVQRSFKEKQQQLSEMRLRYEQIQTEMRKANKKPTPFERLKKIFTRHHHHNHHHHDKNDPAATIPMLNSSTPTITITSSSQRPISSLSTSSSASSGRMSTISGCSVGDSGTHSDTEERKLMFAGTCHHHQSDDDLHRNNRNKQTVMEMNYSAVPVPKPVQQKVFPATKHNSAFETIEEKPPTTTTTVATTTTAAAIRPNNLPLNEEYYIHFPPSGLPVEGFEDNITDQNDASTNSGNLHEYMNCKVTFSR